MFLSQEEIQELTGFKQKERQCNELKRLGIIHRIRNDGMALVAEDHVKDIFGVQSGIENKRTEPDLGSIYG